MFTNNHQDKTLVKLTPDDTFIALQTYDVLHGKSSRFYISIAMLKHWLEETSNTTFLDVDLQNTLKMTLTGEEIYTVINWLNVTNQGTVSGFQQTFYIPISLLARALFGEKIRFTVSRNAESKAHVALSFAGAKRLLSLSKLERRAFSKAIRDNFRWKNSNVTLSADFGKDFFFREETMCGGLCLHEIIVHGKDGADHTGIRYSVHT